MASSSSIDMEQLYHGEAPGPACPSLKASHESVESSRCSATGQKR
jgi:hypothetical protein